MISALKSKVIKELEGKFERINALTLEELQSGIIDNAANEVKNARFMSNNRKTELNKCIKALKTKLDEFYEPFMYDVDKLEVGKEYFEKLNTSYVYKSLGTYVETVNVVKKEATGHGFTDDVAHLSAVFTEEPGIWVEESMGNARLKIYTRKTSVVV